MIAIPLNVVKDTIAFYRKDIDEHIVHVTQKLSALEKRRKNDLNPGEALYLKALIKDIDKIAVASPTELAIYQYQKPFKEFPKPKKRRKGKFNFRHEIIEAMGYRDLRSTFYPKYFARIGIKACIYCNSQLTVSINSYEYLKTKIKGDVKAKFQVDHFLPKSNYPCFSISLFNLYPVCSPCNNAKGNTPVNFQLYSDDTLKTSQSIYKFELATGCVAKFLTTLDREELSINFIDPQKPKQKIKAKGSFSDTFDIHGIYETQKDLAEELIVKSKIYNKAYKLKLISSFDKIFTHASLSNRILIGNYTRPEEIHKRPMAKFTQDIAKQLGLI
jgi:hypothetical protein